MIIYSKQKLKDLVFTHLGPGRRPQSFNFGFGRQLGAQQGLLCRGSDLPFLLYLIAAECQRQKHDPWVVWIEGGTSGIIIFIAPYHYFWGFIRVGRPRKQKRMDFATMLDIALIPC